MRLSSAAMSRANFELLNRAGLNLQAVFNLSELPDEITASISEHVPDLSRFKQLIIFGHGGTRMWESVQRSEFTDSEFSDSDHPIDSFSVDIVNRYFADACSGNSVEILYPHSSRIVPLQKLGTLAGWHHASPFRVGINAEWGSWFAYRAVVLADTEFEVTPKMDAPSPCDSCEEKPCITACPADALAGNHGSLQPCIDYRLTDDSRCKARCFSRLACPVAVEHRYSMEQINYHYSRSMQTIEDYYQ